MRDLAPLFDPSPPVQMSMLRRGVVCAATVLMIGVVCWSFVEAITKEADIAAAVAEARKRERERIYTANMDILAGHDGYIRQVEAMIAQEYRREAK